MPVPTPTSSEPRAVTREQGSAVVPHRLSRLRRAFGQIVPDSVWHNWGWDVLAGICAGIYQGCIWTFALQLARGKMHATGFQMGVASAAPAVGYLFAILWARQMEGRSKL